MISRQISVCTDESAPSSTASMTMAHSDTEESSIPPTDYDYYKGIIHEDSNLEEYDDECDNCDYYADAFEEDLYDEDYIDDDYEEEPNSTQSNPPLSEPRLDSFDSYIVVSVLTATASFAALLDDNPEGDKSLAQESLARNFAILICAICSLSGIYSTVVFSFSSIYGRTAIGMGKYEAYESFLSATAIMRKRAFHMYLLSLVLFIVLLVIAAVDKIDPQLEIPVVILLVVLSAMAYRDWSQIIVAAGVIFAPSSGSNKATNKSSERSHGMRLRSHNDNEFERRESLVGTKSKQI